MSFVESAADDFVYGSGLASVGNVILAIAVRIFALATEPLHCPVVVPSKVRVSSCTAAYYCSSGDCPSISSSASATSCRSLSLSRHLPSLFSRTSNIRSSNVFKCGMIVYQLIIRLPRRRVRCRNRFRCISPWLECWLVIRVGIMCRVEERNA